MATEIEQRNEAKKDWTARLRGKKHRMTWKARRSGPRTYSGQCSRCLGRIVVYPGGGVETSELTTFRRCPNAGR